MGPWSTVQVGRRHARGQQAGPPLGLGPARTHRTHVAAPARERGDDRRLIELHVVGENGNRVSRPEFDLVHHLVRPAEHEAVRLGEPVPGCEGSTAVDDDRLVAELSRESNERAGDLDRTDDDEPRAGRVRLDEQLGAGDLHGPRVTGQQAGARSLDQRLVRVHVGKRADEPAVGVDGQRLRRGLAWTRLVRPRDRGRGVRGEPCHDGPSPTPTIAGVTGSRLGSRRNGGRDQHVDGPATGQAHVPRLLVADAVADHALPAILASGEDRLGRGPLHAPTRHGAGDPAVVGDEQDGSRWARRAAERPDDDCTPDPDALGAPSLERLNQLLQLILRWFVGTPRSRWTR